MGKTDSFRNMDEEEANWNPIKTEVAPEPEEEVKIRVWFADNDYFDDHFDIKKREHLVGKTLAKFARCSTRPFLSGTNNDIKCTIKHSLELLGWTLFEKWDKVVQLLTEIEKGNGVTQECQGAVNFFANKTTENSEAKDSALRALKNLKTVDIDISKNISDEVKSSVSENEKDFINDQLRIYSVWN